MKVTVMMRREKWELGVEDGTTVGILREKVADLVGLPLDGFKMIAKGKKLERELDPVGRNTRLMVMPVEAAKGKEVGGGKAEEVGEAEGKRKEEGEEKVEVAPDGFHVVVATGKGRKIYVECAPSDTFSFLKTEIGRKLQVRADGVRLVWKGRDRKGEEVLETSGINRSGKKLMVLFTEDYYDRAEKVATVDELRKELGQAVKRGISLQRQRDKRLLDNEELLIQAGDLEATFRRLRDNVPYCEETALERHRADIDKNLTELEDILNRLRAT